MMQSNEAKGVGYGKQTELTAVYELQGGVAMGFHNKLYELRKQRGLSQEELACKLNVSRQTVSKWELGDATPEMEKLVAISDLFEISLDELVLGKVPEASGSVSNTSESLLALREKVWTPENKKKFKVGLKIAGIILAVIVVVDLISLIIYLLLSGFPQ